MSERVSERVRLAKGLGGTATAPAAAAVVVVVVIEQRTHDTTRHDKGAKRIRRGY